MASVKLLLIPLVVAVVFLIFPFVIYYGNLLMVVTSTSMVPTLMPNDLLVVGPATIYDVKEDDIIAVDSHSDIGIVVHRAIIITNDIEGKLGIDTKGDNNEEPDPWTIYEDSMIGIVKQKIPYLGVFLILPIKYSFVAVIITVSIFLLRENLKNSKSPY